MSIWLTIVAVAGTLAATVFAQMFQANRATAARSEIYEREWRKDGIDAVATLVTALAHHRMKMWERERIRLVDGGGRDYVNARKQSHETRNAIDYPLARARILLPCLIGQMDAAVQAVYGIRNASSVDALETLRENALAAERALSAATSRHLYPKGN